MEAFIVLFGLIIWFFAIIGFVMGGRKLLAWYTGMVAREPERFKRGLGLDTTEAPRN